MKRFLLAAAVTCVYGVAVLGAIWLPSRVWAQGANNPHFVRKWQGNTRDFREVSCTTAGDVALVSAAQAADALSMYFYNTDGSNFVTLCPRAAGSNQCSTAAQGLTLLKGTGFTSDVSVKSAAWSCKGDTGNVTVEVYIERNSDAAFNPTPTPIPSHTPTPTPTPT